MPKEIRRNKKPVGGKLMHGAMFYNFITGQRFQEINLPGNYVWMTINVPDSILLSNKPSNERTTDYTYLVKDSIPARNWQLLDLQKKILKKNCHAALSVNKNNDSLLVWYTTELAFQKGFLWYDSLPGVVLEALDQKRNCYLKATRIRGKRIRLIPPQEGNMISPDEWIAIRKNIPVKRFEPGAIINISVH